MIFRKAVFLSYPINEKVPLYGGEKSVIFKRLKSIKKGDSCNTMLWSFPNHMGTHIDMPSHFLGNRRSISNLSCSDLIFARVQLIEPKNLRPGHIICQRDLVNIRDCELLLIKTRSGLHRNKDVYWKNSIALSPDLSVSLRKRCPSLRAVGIDSISISNLNKRELGRKAHRAFLGKDILLIEDMKLGGLKVEPDIVIVAPMLVEKADASPCTILGIYN